MFWSGRDWEEQSPLERFFSALANQGRLREREWVWEGKFGSCACPVCGGRGHLWWTAADGHFRFGCKEQCDRSDILEMIGLESWDIQAIRPRWLRKVR